MYSLRSKSSWPRSQGSPRRMRSPQRAQYVSPASTIGRRIRQRVRCAGPYPRASRDFAFDLTRLATSRRIRRDRSKSGEKRPLRSGAEVACLKRRRCGRPRHEPAHEEAHGGGSSMRSLPPRVRARRAVSASRARRASRRALSSDPVPRRPESLRSVAYGESAKTVARSKLCKLRLFGL